MYLRMKMHIHTHTNARPRVFRPLLLNGQIYFDATNMIIIEYLSNSIIFMSLVKLILFRLILLIFVINICRAQTILMRPIRIYVAENDTSLGQSFKTQNVSFRFSHKNSKQIYINVHIIMITIKR